MTDQTFEIGGIQRRIASSEAWQQASQELLAKERRTGAPATVSPPSVDVHARETDKRAFLRQNDAMGVDDEEHPQSAIFAFEDRASVSPLIERVWRSSSERGGRFLSVASPHWEIVMTRLQGRTTVTVRGPETRPTWVDCPADGEWLAIRFKLGTFMRDLPPAALIDRRDVHLPSLSDDGAFGLAGERWTFPELDDAEAFVARLVKAGLVGRDAAVQAALEGDTHALSPRTAQRRIRRATGMTHTLARQIERARRAATLLKRDLAIVEVAHEAGYFDQAHLTRSMRRLIGQTPAMIARAREQLSFLYNTPPSD